MSTEARVGLFVIASLAVLGGAVYYIRTTQSVKGQVPYRALLQYAGGVEPGASVLFGGIKAGQVTAVRPSAEDPTRIEIRFQVRTGTPINGASTTRVGSVSVMTNPVLTISTGNNNARRLTPGETVRSEETVSLEEITRRVATVAESANALILQLRTEVPGITKQAETLLTNLNRIAGPTNQQHIEAILAELNTVLKRESPKIAQITDQILTLAQKADSTVASIQPVVTNVDRTVSNVNETVDAIREQLVRDLTELEHTIVQAKKLIGDVDSVVRTNDLDIADTIRNLRATSDNIRALTETVKREPWSLIRIKQPADRKVPQ